MDALATDSRLGGAHGMRDRLRGVAISRMNQSDMPAVIALLKPIPEVSFCEWEDVGLLGSHLARDNRSFNFTAHSDEGVVGALIAGSVGVRGTISHIAVAPGWRRFGLGRELVSQCLAAFSRHGIRRIFVFTNDENDGGVEFWNELGFAPTVGETTWETDL